MAKKRTLVVLVRDGRAAGGDTLCERGRPCLFPGKG